MEVRFSDADMRLIQQTAEARQKPKDETSIAVTDKRIIKRDNVETHMIGLLGEFAVGRLLNVDVDTLAYISGDQTQDFCVSGVTVEVKTLQGYLAFQKLSYFVADIAVLVVYDKADFSVVSVEGWTTRQEFINRHFVDDFGYGSLPCMQPADLLPISSLKAYCLSVQGMRYLMGQITLTKSEEVSHDRPRTTSAVNAAAR
jgi:hypothetical protein